MGFWSWDFTSGTFSQHFHAPSSTKTTNMAWKFGQNCSCLALHGQQYILIKLNFGTEKYTMGSLLPANLGVGCSWPACQLCRDWGRCLWLPVQDSFSFPLIRSFDKHGQCNPHRIWLAAQSSVV